jgi:hypothetical protein
MFEIFKFKSKTSEEILTCTANQFEVVIDDSDLDVDELESGLKRLKLKISYNLLFT